jgi:iron complex outermembrane recepter protein
MKLDANCRLCCAGLPLLVAGTLSGIQISAAAGDSSNPDALETVVVTAQKYAQDLKDVPMSVAAITGKKLEEEGQLTFTDYAQTVPSLNFASFTEGQNRINIRGMQGITGAATVAYLVDGVVQSLDTGSPDNELFDVNRVEVLRGPQGTLYGAGAVGGAIKIITNSADPTKFEARVSGSLEENEQHAAGHDVAGMVNLPLIQDTLALRAVITQRSMDGYITVREPNFDNSAASSILGIPLKNYSSQNIVATDANSVNVKSGRVGLTWYPTSDHNLEVTAKYGEQRDDLGYASAISPSLQSQYGTFNLTEGGNPAEASKSPLDYKQGNITVNWQLSAVHLESITGYSLLQIDNDLPTALSVPIGPGINLGDVLGVQLTNQHRYLSQEVRLESVDAGPLKWTTGLYYENTLSNILELTEAGPVIAAVDPDNLFGLDSTTAVVQRSREYAIYGQAEYAFTEKWSAILGVRWYQDDYASILAGGAAITPVFVSTSPKIGLSYHYDENVLFYANIASGFRPGGVNFPTITPAPAGFFTNYDPDKVVNYEMGVNSVLMDGKVSFDAAIFDAKWQHFQEDLLLTNTLGAQETITSNAGRAHSAGAEFELTAALPLHLTGQIGGSYLDARLDDAAPNPDLPGGVVPSGTRLENVPPWSGHASLTQEYPIFTDLKLVDSVQYTYRGQTHSDILQANQTLSAPYSLVDLRVGLKDAGNKWEANLFLNNAFNKLASNFAFQSTDTVFIMPLRTLGVRASYNFN